VGIFYNSSQSIDAGKGGFKAKSAKKESAYLRNLEEPFFLSPKDPLEVGFVAQDDDDGQQEA
jgi:hypothetical protein